MNQRKIDINDIIREAIAERISENRFKMWFGSDVHFELQNSVLYIHILSSEFMRQWIRSKFGHVIAQVCSELWGQVYPMEFLLDTPTTEQTPVLVLESDSHPGPALKPKTGARRKPVSQVRSLKSASASTPLLSDIAKSSKKRRITAKSDSSSAELPSPQEEPLSTILNITVSSDRLSTNRKPGSTPVSGSSSRNSRRTKSSQAKSNAQTAEEPVSEEIPSIVKRPLRSETSADVIVSKRKRPARIKKVDSVDKKENSRTGNTKSYPNKTGRQVSPTDLPVKKSPQQPGRELDSSLLMRNVLANQELSEAFHPTETPQPVSNRGKSVKKGEETIPGIRQTSSRVVTFPTENRQSSLVAVSDKNGYNVVNSRAPRAHRKISVLQGDRKFASYDSFIEGISNQLAKRVSDIAILEPNKMNPILIWGPTSVGKTHLLEGIWNEYDRKVNRKSALFLTAEQFTTLFIQSLRNNRNFKDYFKNISLLILDDIHFLQGKMATQAELLNLIDYLKANGVQMIFSANRPPAELTEIRGELATRIESGIVCDIKPPERETLFRIFQQMALQRNLPIPEEVSRFVVSRFTTHARQLSGVLNRLHAMHLVTGQPITLDMAQNTLGDLIRDSRRIIRLEDIERVVLNVFGLEPSMLKSKSRARKSSYPRMLAMWLARKYTRSALSEIGRFFGNRSHSTVISAQKRVDQWIQNGTPVEQGEMLISVSDAVHRLESALNNPPILQS